MNSDRRPDPDALLDRVRREEAQAQRGRLTIFFGSCAGVGKTYGMLLAARIRQQQGKQVLLGVVETHGRSETRELLAGFAVLPPLRLEHRGKQLPEFDLDGALARQPDLILVDELAHSNAPGSRHSKRWQDVEELLTAGIDVYTTLNVQHLESLNDVVGQITGVRVGEKVPDRVFDQAAEVILVDLPPDELLQRLHAGKVYLAGEVARAAQNFFRKGNLIALRELALRRTADRVDAEMLDYRTARAIEQVWQAKERLLACVGPGPEGVRVVRATARLAANLKADWLAVSITTSPREEVPPSERERLLQALQVATDLGAETSLLSGTQLASTLLSFARTHNVSKLVVGKSTRSGWSRWLKPGLAEQLISQAQGLDLHVICHDPEAAPMRTAPPPKIAAARTRQRELQWDGPGTAASGALHPDGQESPKLGHLWAVLVCAAVTALAASLFPQIDLANVIMLYLLSVVLVTVRWGRGPGLNASWLSVAAFDFFFVPPRFSITVNDSQYLVTFAVMLAVALIISSLTSTLHNQTTEALERERRTAALYALTKDLSAALAIPQITAIARRHLDAVFFAQTFILLPDRQDKIGAEPERAAPPPFPVDLSVAQWVYDRQQPAGRGTDTLPSHQMLYLPLKAPLRTRGVLAISAAPAPRLDPPEQRLLATFAAQIALALERVHFLEVAQEAVVAMESERLRNSLLAAISHDLRTPLTAIVGLASTLTTADLDPANRTEMASSIHDEALRLSSLVANLLEMARLQSGGVRLNRQWQPLEEVVGSALRGSQRALAGHPVTVRLPPNLPLIAFDAVLIERVLCNLLENAAKYTPKESEITVSAKVEGHDVWVLVEDCGPGLPPGMGEKLFSKFTRGERAANQPGVGLGLAICRAIVEEHGGRIRAENLADHAGHPPGLCMKFSLPLSDPPAIPTAELETLMPEPADDSSVSSDHGVAGRG